MSKSIKIKTLLLKNKIQLYGCSYIYVTKSTMMLLGYSIKSKILTLLKFIYSIFYPSFNGI